MDNIRLPPLKNLLRLLPSDLPPLITATGTTDTPLSDIVANVPVALLPGRAGGSHSTRDSDMQRCKLLAQACQHLHDHADGLTLDGGDESAPGDGIAKELQVLVFVSMNADENDVRRFLSRFSAPSSRPWVALPCVPPEAAALAGILPPSAETLLLALDIVAGASGGLALYDPSGSALSTNGAALLAAHGATAWPFSSARLSALKAAEVEAPHPELQASALLVTTDRDWLLRGGWTGEVSSKVGGGGGEGGEDTFEKVSIQSLFPAPGASSVSSSDGSGSGNGANGSTASAAGSGSTPEVAPVLGLLFSALWCPPCLPFLRRLRRALLATHSLHSPSSLHVVLVSSDVDPPSFSSHLSASPWLALPFSDSQARQALSVRFLAPSSAPPPPSLPLQDSEQPPPPRELALEGGHGLPYFCLISPTDGRVLLSDARSLVSELPPGAFASAFPFTRSSIAAAKLAFGKRVKALQRASGLAELLPPWLLGPTGLQRCNAVTLGRVSRVHSALLHTGNGEGASGVSGEKNAADTPDAPDGISVVEVSSCATVGLLFVSKRSARSRDFCCDVLQGAYGRANSSSGGGEGGESARACEIVMVVLDEQEVDDDGLEEWADEDEITDSSWIQTLPWLVAASPTAVGREDVEAKQAAPVGSGSADSVDSNWSSELYEAFGGVGLPLLVLLEGSTGKEVTREGVKAVRERGEKALSK